MIRERALYLECPRLSLLAGIVTTRSRYSAASPKYIYRPDLVSCIEIYFDYATDANKSLSLRSSDTASTTSGSLLPKP